MIRHMYQVKQEIMNNSENQLILSIQTTNIMSTETADSTKIQMDNSEETTQLVSKIRIIYSQLL